jgi:hypothetical protein
MDRGAAGSVLREIRTLSTFGTMGGRTDAELLERFLARGEDDAEDAFATLVARHVPMVLGVCRRMLPASHDAEYAFQATFFVLARRAASIAGDAAILTLLGYLDLGIAEALERLQGPELYARPVRYFSLALPLLPLAQLAWIGGREPVSLFYLAASPAPSCGGSRWATRPRCFPTRRCGSAGAAWDGCWLIIPSSTSSRSASPPSSSPR